MYKPNFDKVKESLNRQVEEVKTVAKDSNNPLNKKIMESTMMVGSVRPSWAKKGVEVLPEMQASMTKQLARNNYRLKPFADIASSKLNKLPKTISQQVDEMPRFLGKYKPNFN